MKEERRNAGKIFNTAPGAEEHVMSRRDDDNLDESDKGPTLGAPTAGVQEIGTYGWL